MNHNSLANPTPIYLAFDLGASHARVKLGILQGKQLEISHIQDFPVTTIEQDGWIRWKWSAISEAVGHCLKLVSQKYPGSRLSIGITGWGVDYGYINPQGKIMADPVCYRSPQLPKIAKNFPINPETIFAKSGINFGAINSIYRLYHDHAAWLQTSHHLTCLFFPNLITYWLTGARQNEYSIASTSGVVSLADHQYLSEWFEPFAPDFLQFAPLVYPGTLAGHLLPQWIKTWELNFAETKVVHVNCHDTASAFASFSPNPAGAIGLILGTWIILGQIRQDPLTSPAAYQAGITNEGIGQGAYLSQFLLPGLFVIQRLQQEVKHKEGLYSFQTIAELATTSTEQRSVDLVDTTFFNPKSMKQAIYVALKVQDLATADLFRIAYNSIFKQIQHGLTKWIKITGQQPSQVHLMGGGLQDQFLLNFIKNTLNNLKMKLGVTYQEASVIGNLKVQLAADHQLTPATWNNLAIKFI